MKRIFLVMAAALLAVGLSSFTKSERLDSFLYLDDSSQWQQVPTYIDVPTVCPADVYRQCQLVIDGQLRYIYDGNHVPWMTKFN
jgi:hypothetical protein